MLRTALFVVLAVLALPAGAQQSETAPLPQVRPETPALAEESSETPETPAAAEESPAVPETPLPRPRPVPQVEEPDDLPVGPVPVLAPEPDVEPEAVPEADPIAEEPPPPPVDTRIYQTACPALIAGQVEARMLEPLEGENSCGERSPLAVTGVLVNGRMVPLSSEAIVNCGMATALPEWASEIDGYLGARENTGLARILSGTSYACRPRNNASGAHVSEHGFANALDVTGFELEDGRTIALPAGWGDPLSAEGRLLRFAHGAACSRFTTTLGPEANALHEDHFHLDLGCHGQTCTARLCE